MFETVRVDNINSWISGGGLTGVIISLNWCRMKIKMQCSIITEMKKSMNGMVKQEVHDIQIKTITESVKEIKKDNKEDHSKLFKKLDAMPSEIIKLIRQ